MSYYCPNCGTKLSPITINHDLWVQFFRCESNGCEKTFAKVVDMRNDYPLIEVFQISLIKLTIYRLRMLAKLGVE